MEQRLAAVRERVGQRLVLLCEAEAVRAAAIHPSYARLWQAIGAQVAGGGKYLRPYLIILTHQAYGGREDDTDVAAAWELLHIGLLLHDDVIDRDFMRHGQPNVAGQYLDRYDSEHHAQAAGLLAGDLVLATARQLLTRQVLVGLFDDALFSVIGGELLDMEASLGRDPAAPEIIAQAKTASYSTVGPLLTGATLADAPADQHDLLRALGEVLGLGFQFADDLLVFSTEAGKDVTSDLREGKRTMLLSVLLESLPKAERHKIELTLADNPTAHVTDLSHALDDDQARKIFDKKLADYERRAIELIDQLDIADEYRAEFKTLTQAMLYRNT